jgi:hypothetical protein
VLEIISSLLKSKVHKELCIERNKAVQLYEQRIQEIQSTAPCCVLLSLKLSAFTFLTSSDPGQVIRVRL